MYAFLKFLFVFLFAFSIHSAEPQHASLKISDVQKVMAQLFKDHLDKKEMSPELMKMSLKRYIEQFDPNKIYLLEEEVSPYLNISENRLKTAISEYKNNNFEIFKNLNRMIMHSIQRAQEFRQTLLKNPSLLSHYSGGIESTEDYAKTILELNKRTVRDFIQTYTTDPLKLSQELTIYDQSMRQNEDPYITQKDADHYLTLHILKAFASSLDSHTKFLDTDEAYDMKIRLEKSILGIGIRLKQRGTAVVIEEIIPGGSAAKSGKIQLQDRIIAINGIPVKDVKMAKVLKLLHQAKKEDLVLTLERPSSSGHEPSQTITVTLNKTDLTIDEGRVKATYEKFQDGIIGKIALQSFYRGKNGVSSINDLKKEIQNLQKEGRILGLILDLRENLGGYLTEAVQIAGQFITSGVIVISKYSNGEEMFFRDVDGKVIFRGPIVVLTSRETASAAEIVAQALQDYGVALIVGDEHTYGKGTIQSQTVTKEDKTPYFKVTVGKYYTVSGKTPQKRGVQANILVPSLLNNAPIGEEFLEITESADSIPNAYDDTLSDVQPSLKGWYLRFYAEKHQPRIDTWTKMLPTLRKKSQERISRNDDYQTLLRHGYSLSGKAWLFPDKPHKNVQKDLQMNEAVSILQDMITIDKKE